MPDTSKTAVARKFTQKGSVAGGKRQVVGKLEPDLSPQDETGIMIVRGMMANAVAIDKWSGAFSSMDGGLDLGSIYLALTESSDRARKGDLGDAESLLMAQGTTLNAVFADLLLKAGESKLLDHFERYIRLALKAQTQSRATFETLAVVKNPPVFAKQANIANGPQQVNNGVAPRIETRVGARVESQSRPIELLEARSSERMDGAASKKAGEGDKAMASMGQVNRSQKRRG